MDMPLSFNPESLVRETLPVAAKGMVGIFLVIAIIMLCIFILNKIPSKGKR